MKRVWKSNIQECLWSPTGTIDVGQKVNIEVEEIKRIVLTENDLHFFPTQEQLKTIEFVAPKEIYDKLFLLCVPCLPLLLVTISPLLQLTRNYKEWKGQR